MTNNNRFFLIEVSISGAITETSITELDSDEIEDMEICDIISNGSITNTQKVLMLDEDEGDLTDISDTLDHGTLFRDNL